MDIYSTEPNPRPELPLRLDGDQDGSLVPWDLSTRVPQQALDFGDCSTLPFHPDAHK
jgi:hypothetical protein